jgi:hypothetical protein
VVFLALTVLTVLQMCNAGASGYSEGDGVHPKAAGSSHLAHLVAPSLIARFKKGAPPLEPIGAPLEKAMRVVPGISIPERVYPGDSIGPTGQPPANGFQTERSGQMETPAPIPHCFNPTPSLAFPGTFGNEILLEAHVTSLMYEFEMLARHLYYIIF